MAKKIPYDINYFCRAMLDQYPVDQQISEAINIFSYLLYLFYQMASNPT